MRQEKPDPPMPGPFKIKVVADGPYGTIGTLGVRLTCYVFGFVRKEPNNDIISYDITLLPSANAANVPAWFTIGT